MWPARSGRRGRAREASRSIIERRREIHRAPVSRQTGARGGERLHCGARSVEGWPALERPWRCRAGRVAAERSRRASEPARAKLARNRSADAGNGARQKFECERSDPGGTPRRCQRPVCVKPRSKGIASVDRAPGDQRRGIRKSVEEGKAIRSVLETEVCERKECEDQKTEVGRCGGVRGRSAEDRRERCAAGLVEDRLRAGVGAGDAERAVGGIAAARSALQTADYARVDAHDRARAVVA